METWNFTEANIFHNNFLKDKKTIQGSPDLKKTKKKTEMQLLQRRICYFFSLHEI